MARRDEDTPDRPTSSPALQRIEEALRLLAEEVRGRLERHPWGHLLGGRGETLPLTLSLPASLREDLTEHTLEETAAATAKALGESLEGLLTHRAALRPGAVFCLRCRRADCEHARPADPRQVFAGWGKTGLPRFADLGQLLLEQQDPQVDLLYRDPPQLVARVHSGRELARELLPAYRDPGTGYRIHGQVVAGWYRVPDPSGRPQSLAVTLQVVSTRPRGAHDRRFGLNVLGLGPGGEPLENLYDRLGSIPWTDTVRWAQGVLDSVERAARRRGGKGKKSGKRKGAGSPADRSLHRRLEGLLAAMARRLLKHRRAADRKTHHARERHAQGDRPTPMALPDLARATPEDFLVDVRADTFVVLGERGRAHVFSPEGKHVTSVRYNPDSITRRRDRGLWRPASREEISAFEEKVALREKGEGEPPASLR